MKKMSGNLKIKCLSAAIVFFTTVIFLNSCRILQPYKSQSFVNSKSLYRDQVNGDTANLANVPWDSLFTDPVLDTLITEALKNNPDLQAAKVSIKKAEAALGQAKAAFFPTFSLMAGATNQAASGASGVTVAEVAGSSAWEADIWGRIRNSKRATYNMVLKSEAYARAVKTQLVADVANLYYTLLGLDAQLDITKKTVLNRNSEVETMKVMKDNDMITGADLVMSQSSLYSAKVRIPDLEQAIYETENALCLVLGRGPGPVKRGKLENQDIRIKLSQGIPAQLLANRPDVQEAEYQLRYGFEMTKAARKSFYPSLTVTATGGYMAGDVAKLFNPSSIFWTFLGGLTQPVFNAGLNRQRLKTAQADQEQNLIAYKQVLLRAGKEVADAVNGYRNNQEKISLRAKQIEYMEKSVSYTTELLKYSSTTNYTDVLTAEAGLLSAQLSNIDDRLQKLQYIIDLYRSLGGGWKY